MFRGRGCPRSAVIDAVGVAQVQIVAKQELAIFPIAAPIRESSRMSQPSVVPLRASTSEAATEIIG